MSNSLIDTLIRDAIGYDCLARFGLEPALKYPPHNITSMGDNQYTLTMAVAGFSREHLSVAVEKNQLTVKGTREDEYQKPAYRMLYQGLAFRNFTRSWQLGEYMEVSEVKLLDGLLIVDLIRNIPESKKPRTIVIK